MASRSFEVLLFCVINLKRRLLHLYILYAVIPSKRPGGRVVMHCSSDLRVFFLETSELLPQGLRFSEFSTSKVLYDMFLKRITL